MHRSVPAVLGAVTLLSPTAVAFTASAEAATHSSATTAAVAKRYSGTSVNTRWGLVKVVITVSGKKILNVSATLPTERSRSAFINSQAGPILRSEVMKAQSASIQTVGGATVTSLGYEQSLQAAVTAAHI